MKERKIKAIDSLFGGDSFQEPKQAGQLISQISIDKLKPYTNHPFKLYTGKRLEDMIESIKENGVMTPIIITPAEKDTFMILSGHNRANAAKLAGLNEVPAIIKENVSSGEAKLIVTQTNFFQRSVSDMLPSEKAWAFKLELEGLKEERKGSKKIKAVNEIENSEEKSVQIEHQEKSRDFLAKRYNISPAEIQRYIRLTHLNKELLDLVDEETIPVNSGVNISHITSEEQVMLLNYIMTHTQKIDLEKSELIKLYSKNNDLTEENMIKILNGEISKNDKNKKYSNSISIKQNILSKFFTTENDKEIVHKVEKALELRELAIPNLIRKYNVETDDIEALTIEALDFYLSKKRK